MIDNKGHLDKAYELESDSFDTTKGFYADWAETYDKEVAENGYITPARCAEALAKFAPLDSTILDVGCGTGLSGMALRKTGFSCIDGCDMTLEMLEKAKDLNLYRNLWIADPHSKLDFTRGPYGVVSAIGVIGAGAAPISLLQDITEQMNSGAYLLFSFNDHTLKDPTYDRIVMNLIKTGHFRLHLKEYGPHIPKRNMNSNIYVMQKS